MARPFALLTFATAAALYTGYTGHAHAAPSPSEEEADRLFREANDLVSLGSYEPACPKLERSQELDPGVGTQFNLADCYEHTGRPAQAYRLFVEVERVAQATGKRERATQAHQRSTALAPKVPHVKLAMGEPTQGADVRIDGNAVGRLDEPLLVEPGPHLVTFAAPGRLPWHTTLVAAEGGSIELVMPKLEPAPPETKPVEQRRESPHGGLGVQRVIGIAKVGLGIVGLGLGTYLGLSSKAKHDDAAAICPQRDACPTQAGVDAWHDATSTGTLATVAFALGALSTVVGTVLWVTAPSPSSPRSTTPTGVRFAPSIARDGAGLTLTGAWH